MKGHDVKTAQLINLERESMRDVSLPIIAAYPELHGYNLDSLSIVLTLGPLLSLINKNEVDKEDFVEFIDSGMAEIFDKLDKGLLKTKKHTVKKKQVFHQKEIAWLTIIDSLIDKSVDGNVQLSLPKYPHTRGDFDFLRTELLKIIDLYKDKYNTIALAYTDDRGAKQVDYPYKWPKKTSLWVVSAIEHIIETLSENADKKADDKKICIGLLKTEKDKIQQLGLLTVLPHNKESSKASIIALAKGELAFLYDRNKDVLFYIKATDKSFVFVGKIILCDEVESFSLKHPTKFIFSQGFESTYTLVKTHKKRKQINSITLNEHIEIISVKQ